MPKASPFQRWIVETCAPRNDRAARLVAKVLDDELLSWEKSRLRPKNVWAATRLVALMYNKIVDYPNLPASHCRHTLRRELIAIRESQLLPELETSGFGEFARIPAPQ